MDTSATDPRVTDRRLATTDRDAAPAAPTPAWLDRALYPFAPNFFPTSDGRIHYVDQGAGPPVLLVHGTPVWSFIWRDVIRALAPDARCVAPDHLGFGLSDKPAGAPYRPADHARRLGELVRALDLRDVTLVVHDFGGPIGLGWALEDLARVRRVVVLNTWAWSNEDQPAVRRLSAFVAGPLGRFLYRWLNASPRWLVPASYGDRAKLTPAVHRHLTAPFAHRRERDAPWVLGRELWGSNAFYASIWAQRDRLAPRVAQLVWGARDKALTAERHLARWREACPAAEVTVCERAGHFVQDEAPDAVARAVRRALG